MKVLRYLLVALAALIGHAILPATAAVLESPKDINLLFIGNSITAGATLSNRSVEAPPIVCGELVKQATGITTNVYNGGHSGITTYGFLPGTKDFTNVVNAAKAFQSSNGGKLYFSIMLGTNDSSYSPGNSASKGGPATPEVYKENMKKIIDELIAQFPDCKILVNYPIWYSPNTYNGAKYLQEGLDRLRTFYPVIDNLVMAYDQVFAGNRGAWEAFENRPALFTSESGHAGIFHLHPNAQGARHLAELWANSLLEILQADGITTVK